MIFEPEDQIELTQKVCSLKGSDKIFNDLSRKIEGDSARRVYLKLQRIGNICINPAGKFLNMHMDGYGTENIGWNALLICD